LPWANSQIHENRDKLSGKWIYVLDDDDWLIYPRFIEDLKKIDKNNNPDVVICKGYIGPNLYPSEGYWERRPLRATIGSPNFIVKTNFFLKYSFEWCRPKAADFFFINTVYQNAATYWWDKIVFKAPIGDSKPE